MDSMACKASVCLIQGQLAAPSAPAPAATAAAATAAAANSVLPAWDDESGLEDLDIDSMVSQHRSRVSPPVVPAAQHNLTATSRSQQHTVRPAAAAAGAAVRINALPISTPPVPQAFTAACSAPAPQTQTSAPEHPAEALGLDAVNERLLELADLIISSALDPREMAVLHEERRCLKDVKTKLTQAANAAPQHSRPPPESHAASMHAAPPAMVSNPYPSSQPPQRSRGPYQAPQPAAANNWQPNNPLQPAQQHSMHSTGVWDTSETPSSYQANPQGPGRTSFNSSNYNSGNYNSSNDMGMPAPDPDLRPAAPAGIKHMTHVHQCCSSKHGFT